ncbi:hypothetical protein BOX15_Mlig030952g3 [Macrostomum lignano]|uniref:Phosphatidate cytidylyltransferase n=1 Tax=Macrostomum lignano TaxID=282301 RepID=A0A267FTP3_9PLAT|nr:hypothetical protein BOX15_Mlig030952g3 [Macrostomum lignano]
MADSLNDESGVEDKKKEELEVGQGLKSDEVRRRKVASADSADDEPAAAPVDPAVAQSIGQGTDQSPGILQRLLAPLPPRWQNWVVRGIMSIVMIVIFSVIVYLGPLAMVVLILIIQMMCFYEIINIGYVVYKSQDLPWFRTLSWFFLFTSNYFFFGESMIDQFRILLQRDQFLQPLLTYHRFISFCLYCGGIVGFVVSLVKKHYLQQFTLFGWTHMALLVLVTSSHFMIRNVFNGVIWLLLPSSMIICNDIMAYMFGFFFGKTPLIKLSPKKTWEGFIGGGLSTILFSVLLSHFLIQFDFFVCPLEYDEVSDAVSMNCVRHWIFERSTFHIPVVGKLLFLSSIPWYPFYWHSIIMATFASFVGPFGGFFASGFKRAFKIKDFGDLIPGHGGMTDRFDCQIIMGTFVYVYFQTFIMVTSPHHLLRQVYSLRPDDQLKFYEALTDGLTKRGLLNGTTGI